MNIHMYKHMTTPVTPNFHVTVYIYIYMHKYIYIYIYNIHIYIPGPEIRSHDTTPVTPNFHVADVLTFAWSRVLFGRAR